jgi:hypothetical protein
VKRVWTALRHRITAVVLDEPLWFSNLIRYSGGRLDLGCYEFVRQHTVLTLVTLWSVSLAQSAQMSRSSQSARSVGCS